MILSFQRAELEAAEKTNQRELAERLADIRRVDAVHAVERAAARAAIEIQSQRRRFSAETFGLPRQHLAQIFARSRAVAQRKQHALALEDLFGDRENARARIEPHDIADQIV